MPRYTDITPPEIFFEKIGDWAKVEKTLAALPLAIKASADWGQRKVAEKLVKIVKGHIDNQDLGWAPLIHPQLSGDPRILVDYETYRNNIKTWQKGGSRYVGVKKDVRNRKGIETWYYAAIHEYKSYHGGPYRALWGPSIKEIGGAQGVRKTIEEAIGKKITQLGL